MADNNKNQKNESKGKDKVKLPQIPEFNTDREHIRGQIDSEKAEKRIKR